MSDSERRKKGLEQFNKVYCGDIPAPEKGGSAFFDLMIEQLFAEVWSREGLATRDRRLLLLGAIAALGEPMTFAIQTRAAIKNGELTPDQVREAHIHLAQYVGYPRAASLIGPMEQAIAQAQKDLEAAS